MGTPGIGNCKQYQLHGGFPLICTMSCNYIITRWAPASKSAKLPPHTVAIDDEPTCTREYQVSEMADNVRGLSLCSTVRLKNLSIDPDGEGIRVRHQRSESLLRQTTYKQTHVHCVHTDVMNM